MAEVMLPLNESQVIELTRQLSPEGKRAVLRSLIPDIDQFENLVDYGNARIRALAEQRGIDWDIPEGISESEREELVDTLLHEEA